MIFREGARHNALDAQRPRMHHHEDLRLEVLADRRHEHVHLANLLRLQGIAMRGVHPDGQRHLILHQVEAVHVAVDGDDLRAGAGQADGGGASEVA